MNLFDAFLAGVRACAKELRKQRYASAKRTLETLEEDGSKKAIVKPEESTAQ